MVGADVTGCLLRAEQHVLLMNGSSRLPAMQPTCRPGFTRCATYPSVPCRLVACFGLLVVGRVVNIALPVAYKKVIDRLADTSAAAAAAAAAATNGGGNGGAALCAALLRAVKPTFHDVFLPWVAVYLTLAFLQASSQTVLWFHWPLS